MSARRFKIGDIVTWRHDLSKTFIILDLHDDGYIVQSIPLEIKYFLDDEELILLT